MTVAFSDSDLADFRSSMRGFLTRRSASAEVRRHMETDDGVDTALWDDASSQLGLPGLAVPEEYGGAGYGVALLNAAAEETGRTLACIPFFSSVVLGANALLHVGDEESKHELMPRIADGSTRVAAAFGENSWAQGLLSPETSAYAGRGDEWKLNGHKTVAIDGATADLLLVTARTQLGTTLFAVDADADGVTRTSVPVLDLTRKHADITLSHASARLVGVEGGAETGLRRMNDIALIALAAEQVGGAERCLEMTLEYLKVRTQFGRLLGSFQALKHRCSDMLIEIQAARALADAGADAADIGDWEQTSMLAALAKATCSEMYARVTAETVQLHGGIGYTWEHDAHLYFKRARSSQYLFGSPNDHRERVLEKLGL